MAMDIVETADRLLAEGRTAEAIAAIVGAAQRGDPDALFRHAIWLLAGHPIVRDVAAALSGLTRAAAAGHAEAMLMEAALVGNGSGTPADWPRARTLLERAATRVGGAAAAQCALLDRMRLNRDGSPADVPRAIRIGTDPDVRHASALFSPDECLHVAQCVVDLLAPSTVVDPRTGANVAHPIRTSEAAVIGPTRETLVVQALNRRIAALSDTDIRQGEALAVLRYQRGQEFRPHLDAITGAHNQRVATVLIYLNAGFVGGETVFERSGLTVRPAAGDAIVFANVTGDGAPDPATRHAGAPVVQGTKWLATRWIRARPFDVWRGPESA